FGIEGMLYVQKCPVNSRPEQFLVQIAPCQSVSMLAAHAAAEFDHKVGDLIGHILHDLNINRILGVDQRPDVQAADTRMSVVSSRRAVLVNDVAEPDEKLRKFGWLHRAVFNECNRLSSTFHSQ